MDSTSNIFSIGYIFALSLFEQGNSWIYVFFSFTYINRQKNEELLKLSNSNKFNKGECLASESFFFFFLHSVIWWNAIMSFSTFLQQGETWDRHDYESFGKLQENLFSNRSNNFIFLELYVAFPLFFTFFLLFFLKVR